MAKTETLLNLRTQIREYTDCLRDPHITNTFLNSVINRAISQFVDLVISTFGTEYYVENTSLTTDGTNALDLPSDFYKIVGLDQQITDDYYEEIYRFNFHDRNQNNAANIISIYGVDTEYRVIGNEIVFAPIPLSGKTLRLWYIPTSTVLTDDTETFDFINGWEEYVILFGSIRVKLKKEESISDYKKLLNEQRDIILLAGENRDSANEEYISDVYDKRHFVRGSYG